MVTVNLDSAGNPQCMSMPWREPIAGDYENPDSTRPFKVFSRRILLIIHKAMRG